MLSNIFIFSKTLKLQILQKFRRMLRNLKKKIAESSIAKQDLWFNLFNIYLKDQKFCETFFWNIDKTFGDDMLSPIPALLRNKHNITG